MNVIYETFLESGLKEIDPIKKKIISEFMSSFESIARVINNPLSLIFMAF